MKTIYAETKLRKYPVYIGSGLLNSASGLVKKHFPGAEKILFISNDVVYGIYRDMADVFLNGCAKAIKKVILKDGEAQKNLENTQYIYEQMLDFNMHKNDLVIAFGGGVTGDMAGFAASTFHRGIKLLQMPTTIMSQVDSSIGGKVVVNFKNTKNVIGSYYQPHAIIMDTLFLETLGEKDIINGLAEIVKYGIVFDQNILKLLDHMAPGKITQGQLKELILNPRFVDITYCCAKIKTSVVKRDEFDNNYRNLLNFGHTAGHAMEKIYGLRGLNHGQAVAIGMIVAIDISISLGLLKHSFRQDIINLYKKLQLPYSLEIKPEQNERKLTVPEIEALPPADFRTEPSASDKIAEDVFNAMKFDKKFSSSTNKFILLKSMNKPVFYNNAGEKVIKDAILKNISI